MTAVDFLKEQLENINKTQVEWHEAFTKALEMEKQQIIDAYRSGYNFECSCYPQQYYETLKNETT